MSGSKKARNYFQVWIFLTSDMDSGRSGEKIYIDCKKDILLRISKRYNTYIFGFFFIEISGGTKNSSFLNISSIVI